MKYLRLLRVKHYIKNGLVFLPLFFAKEMTATGLLYKQNLPVWQPGNTGNVDFSEIEAEFRV